MQETQEILWAFKNRDVKAVKELFDSVFTRLRFLAERITRNADEARDIAMSSIASLWEPDVPGMAKIDNLMGYLTTRVQHDCVDYLRKERSKKNYQNHLINTEEQSEEFLVERARYETEVMHIIYKEIERLPEKTREVFKRVYLQKIPRSDVARQLQISINTVHVHCSKAIKDLRQVISEKELLLILVLLSLYKNN